MLNVRILGQQPEPTLLRKGYEINDLQMRTNDKAAFAKGKKLVQDFVSKNFGSLTEDEFYIINDPMQITIGDASGDTGKFRLNLLVVQLEKLGFFGKSAGYVEPTYSPEFARSFNKAVSSKQNINNDGSINWNYVDADVYLDAKENNPLLDDNNHYNTFESIAIQYDLANGVYA
jgi:hypothetical protein